ncbi:hypothetical protein ACIBEA_03245 [Streptomyces sp. NPDC051555]|uniref:hypothetical protein n=1 Tax=Streptomyces sp. NPDC051555 TaxID=3365657 RepID=UPI0037BDE8BC
MSVAHRAAAALAVLATGAALLVTGCSPGTGARPAAERSAGAGDDAQRAQMQQKLDDADKAAADADADAGRGD